LKVVMKVQPVEGGGKRAPVEYYYSNHKQMEGLNWPIKKVVFMDGKKLTEGEVTEFKFVDKFDDAEFAKPSRKGRAGLGPTSAGAPAGVSAGRGKRQAEKTPP